MTVVSVEIEDKVAVDVKRMAESLNLPSDQLINRILKNYLHIQKMNDLRQELKGTAEAAGFFSEEDIYREIS